MSAQTIFEHAPIGAIIAWSDGSPRPPERHRRKLDTWTTNNSQRRLIRKQGTRDAGVLDPHASFTLHEADYGAGGVIAIRVHRTFAPGSRLRFTIVERPAVGSVRVFDRTGVDAEHLCIWRRIALPPSSGLRNTALPMPCLRTSRLRKRSRKSSRGGAVA